MDKHESILYRTQQSWKLTVAAGGIIISGVLVTLSLIRINLPPTRVSQQLGIVGGLVSLLSFAFPLATIRCPKCGSHWLWRATMQKEINWRQWLLSQRVCPKCQSPCSTAAT